MKSCCFIVCNVYFLNIKKKLKYAGSIILSHVKILQQKFVIAHGFKFGETTKKIDARHVSDCVKVMERWPHLINRKVQSITTIVILINLSSTSNEPGTVKTTYKLVVGPFYSHVFRGLSSFFAHHIYPSMSLVWFFPSPLLFYSSCPVGSNKSNIFMGKLLAEVLVFTHEFYKYFAVKSHNVRLNY